MSKPIISALRELRSVIVQISFMTWFLDSLVVFLVSELVLLLITLPWFYAFVPTGFYSLLHLMQAMRTWSYRHVEEKVPELNEQIRTVADHTAESSEIVEGLNQEVISKMKQIRTSYFFSFGKLTRELFLLFVCSFLIIGASAYHVRFIDVEQVAKEIRDFRQPGEYELDESLLGYEEGNESDDIYGDKSIAELGSEELNLEINPLLSDADMSQVRDPEHRQFRSNVPREIAASTDASFEESIPKGYQRIVKSYFREITKVK